MRFRRAAELQLPQSIILQDGTPVTIRVASADDVPRLQAMHTRLSSQSIYLRYFTCFRELSAERATAMCETDERHVNIVANVTGQEDVIAIVEYVHETDHPSTAEVGILVEDAYQRRGLGTNMLKLILRHARAHGVKLINANVHVDNMPMRRLLERCDVPYGVKYREGMWAMELYLDREVRYRDKLRLLPRLQCGMGLRQLGQNILLFELGLLLNGLRFTQHQITQRIYPGDQTEPDRDSETKVPASIQE